jgi:hypothetical protein
MQKRKRFILIDREQGNVFGDTAFDWNGQKVPPISGLSPVRAAWILANPDASDQPRYRYRTVRRSHPNVVLDAYRAQPSFPRAAKGSPADKVARECEYVSSLARVYPRCSICKQPMAPSEHGIDNPWLYGYTVDWNAPGDKRCCSHCYVNRVTPARLKAEGA